jgi:D-alanyl-D-alanine carboxypeptidase
MKQRFKNLIISTLLFTTIFNIFPGSVAYATTITNTPTETSSTSENAETEREFLDSYYLPIQSNEILGWPEGPAVEAGAAIVMDADTGAILYEKNIDMELYPASITKIVTTMVALEHGNLDDIIPFSDFSVNSLDADSSMVGMIPGEEITLADALYGLMMASGNEIANAIAEYYGGTVEGFVDMMNQKVAELGCQHTHFTNPHGLHDENHYTSAYDMAIISRAALSNPLFLTFAGRKSYIIPPTNLIEEERGMANNHKMLIDNTEFTYAECVGGKTGFTDEALNTLATYTRKDGINLICITLKVNGAERNYRATTTLLNYVYENFSLVSISENDPTLNYSFKQPHANIFSLQSGHPLITIVGKDVLLLPKTLTFDDLEHVLTFDENLPEVNPTRTYFYNGNFLGSTSEQHQLPFTTRLEQARLREKTIAQIQSEETAPLEAAITTEIVLETTFETELETVNTNNKLLNFLYSIKNNQLYLLITIAVFIVLLMISLVIVMLIKNHKAQKRRAIKKQEE